MLAFHGVFGTYGFWLPNDPRGSWSTWVGSWNLYRAGGKATKVSVTHSLAGVPHDRELRRQAKAALHYPPVLFNGVQARAVGRGFAIAVAKSNYKILACAILPEHVHVVVGDCGRKPDMVIGHLKGAATHQLVAEGIHPLRDVYEATRKLPDCWARKGWKVFLDTEEEVHRAIAYVENNPVKEGKPKQNWSFVVPYR